MFKILYTPSVRLDTSALTLPLRNRITLSIVLSDTNYMIVVRLSKLVYQLLVLYVVQCANEEFDT